MNVPTTWTILDTVESTQQYAARCLRDGEDVGVVFAHHQSTGKGRFGRPWISERGDSLTMSIVFADYVGHPRPWLVGMATACAAAEVLDCGLRWPNDLGLDGFKLGGILTELLADRHRRTVPVVGLGVNLGQTSFPEPLDAVATSIAIRRGEAPEPLALARQILARLAEMPEPSRWEDIEPVWSSHDATPGKRYRLPSGGEAIAVKVGSGGELLCTVEGAAKTVLAADAIFGVPA